MKRNFLSITSLSLGLAAMLFATQDAGAVKAFPGIIEVTQPDGSVLPIRIHGDERSNFKATADGLMIIEVDGNYQYAVADQTGKPVASGITARSASQRSDYDRAWLGKINQEELREAVVSKSVMAKKSAKANASESTDWVRPKYTFSSNAFPAKGSPHSIVILVEYTDVKFSMADPQAYYNDFLNGEDFTQNGGTGSARQYFIDNSMGQFTPVFDCYGPVPLKYNRAYYGKNDRTYDQDEKAEYMVIEAIQYLDPTVDFSQYDHNKDGKIDNIFVIYAGTGEATGGPSDSVWPHSWELTDGGYNIKADGVLADTYGCTNELIGRTPSGIGTYVHEFSHVIGLPDLYNTVSSSDYTTPGDFSVLDQGNYNNNSNTPAGYSIHERYALEWMQPEEILSSGVYELPAIVETNNGYIMTTEDNEDEFYLLECRILQGWDRYLPKDGMLVWHIDFDQAVWDRNMPNNKPSHHYVDLVPADNSRSYSSYTGDPFPGSRRVTSFTSTTSPALKAWNGKALNVNAITDIAYDNVAKTVTFKAACTEERGGYGGVALTPDSEGSVTLDGRTLYMTGAGEESVYDITGRKVGVVNAANSVELSSGIYIVDGKKYMVK